jgi:hypothetical protein
MRDAPRICAQRSENPGIKRVDDTVAVQVKRIVRATCGRV